jgi:RNA polymerase sigma-70 factor (ECF subfamily)
MAERHPYHILLPPQEQTLRHRALKLTSNEHWAEDLVQATFLKAWANRDKYKPDSQLRAWLFTILYNTFISDLRKSRREVEDVDGAMAATLFEEPRQDHVLALNELISALALLPNIQRRALVLMGAHGFSQLEAADACGCTVGTIKSRVSRGRTTLNRAFVHELVFRRGTSPRARATLRPALPPGGASDTALMAERIAAE